VAQPCFNLTLHKRYGRICRAFDAQNAGCEYTNGDRIQQYALRHALFTLLKASLPAQRKRERQE
jgi:hypothetical protein